MQDSDFGAALEGTTVTLSTPSYRFRLDTAANLRALSWENLLTGHTVDLGRGDECAVELDAADERVWIEGWRIFTTSDCPAELDGDSGNEFHSEVAALGEGLFEESESEVEEAASAAPAQRARPAPRPAPAVDRKSVV